MMNLFFDVLPAEIRQEIYGIRLSDALMRNFYRRLAQKIALASSVMKIELSYNLSLYDTGHVSMPYFNPVNSNVRYLAERCSEVITDSHDCIWWISQLIRPIEEGLIIQEIIAASWPVELKLGPFANENYRRTEYAVDRLIEKFGCRRNPNRGSSLS
jgi:hypothetical protein